MRRVCDACSVCLGVRKRGQPRTLDPRVSNTSPSRRSCFARLQDSGLATSLSSGTRVEDDNETIFQVDVGLTPEGEVRWRDVLKVVFGYFKVLRGAGHERLGEVWDQNVRLNEIGFEQMTPGAGYGYCASVSQVRERGGEGGGCECL